MRTRTFVALSAVALLVSCGKSPAIPSQPTGVATSLTINGPSTVGPGETAPFTVTARMNDGTTQDYTSRVTWRSTNTLVLSISAAGQASGRGVGEAQVLASFARLQAGMNVMVIPGGTYRLTGTVLESGLPVSGASGGRRGDSV